MIAAFAFGDVHPLLASLQCSFTSTELSEFIHPPVVGCITHSTPGTGTVPSSQECNPRSYRNDPTPFRRLHEVHQVPGLPQEAVHYPTSPWAQPAGSNCRDGYETVETCWDMFGTSIHFFPKHLTSGPGGVGLLGSSVFLFHGSGCLELSLPAALAAFGCIWLSGVAMVAWIAFFLRLPPAVLGFVACMCRYVVFAFVSGCAWFLGSCSQTCWVHLWSAWRVLVPKEWWYGRVSGCASFYSALLVCWAARFAASFYVFGSPCSIQLFRVAGAVSFSCLGGLRWKQNGTCHWMAGGDVLRRTEFLHTSCWFTKNGVCVCPTVCVWFRIRRHFGAADSGHLSYEKPWEDMILVGARNRASSPSHAGMASLCKLGPRMS